ncbi:hypothetical protein HRbin22_01112 [Candidatus Thermoflexus japonica]|uniref:Uncharacterized protein n=1 Tax=Candidatus Thermoflexus japonica TaxID=2035417 RepID=A0A2H5Y5Z6_9CHLR|nr:hypothetical protein HRbin22_01112 [Candidatus Thermoflexus japonica]
MLTENLRRENQILWLLTIIGLTIRIAAIFALDDYREPLTAEYGVVARNLVAGKGFVGGGWLGPEGPTALNVPIYPLFLATWLWLKIPLPFLGVELSQAFLSALLIYLWGKIALRFYDSPVSLLTGLFIAFYPPLIYFCKQISPAIFTTFFTAIAFYVLLLLFFKPTWGRAILFGLTWGVSLLVEPILLLAIPGIMLIGWMWWYKGHRTIVPKMIIGTAICIFVVLPWTIRNYIVFHRLVILKTSFGLNLWMGNNPNATGFLYTASGEPMQNTLSKSMLEYLSSLNEAERYAVLGQKAWEWIKSNPDKFLYLTLKRIGYLWLISPTYLITKQNINEPIYFYEARYVIQLLLLMLAIIGSIFAYQQNRVFVLMCAWCLIAFTIPYAVSVAGNTRYRLPAEPMLIVLAAVLFRKILGRVEKHKIMFPRTGLCGLFYPKL